jgi:hypothetical protein
LITAAALVYVAWLVFAVVTMLGIEPDWLM